MKKTYKPCAWEIQGDCDHGLGTSHCKTKEKAYDLFVEYCRTDFPDIVIDKDKIKQTSMYRCKDCDMFTLESPECFECGETLNSRPRISFVYYFTE